MRLIQIAFLILIFFSHSGGPCQAVTHTNSDEESSCSSKKPRLSAKRRKKALKERGNNYLKQLSISPHKEAFLDELVKHVDEFIATTENTQIKKGVAAIKKGFLKEEGQDKYETWELLLNKHQIWEELLPKLKETARQYFWYKEAYAQKLLYFRFFSTTSLNTVPQVNWDESFSLNQKNEKYKSPDLLNAKAKIKCLKLLEQIENNKQDIKRLKSEYFKSYYTPTAVVFCIAICITIYNLFFS